MTTNISRVSIGALIDMLTMLYVEMINNDIEYATIPSPFLWGAPGVGKSEGIRKLAKNIEEKTGKKVHVTDVRLLMFTPVDIRGLPIEDTERKDENIEKKFAKWIMPKIFDFDPSEDVVNLLFLDELSAAPQSVQAVAYQLVLDRKVGEHSFPDNTVIIAAGNRLSDRSVVHRMPNALANRLMHFEVVVDFARWKEWALNNKVHPLVIGYLTFDQGKLCQEEVPMDNTAFCTPRTWVFVSNILKTLSSIKDISLLYGFISGCIGSGAAMEFIAWCKNHANIPDPEGIFKGKNVKYPKTSDALFALVNAMVAYAKKEKVTGEELERMVRYASKFPADYQAALYTDLCMDEAIKNKLIKIPLFREWMKK